MEKPGSCHLKLLIKVNIISVGQIESTLSCQASVRRTQHHFNAVPPKDAYPECDLRKLQTKLNGGMLCEVSGPNHKVVQVLEEPRCKMR